MHCPNPAEYRAGAVRLGIKRVFLTGSWADVQVSAERVRTVPAESVLSEQEEFGA